MLPPGLVDSPLGVHLVAVLLMASCGVGFVAGVGLSVSIRLVIVCTSASKYALDHPSVWPDCSASTYGINDLDLLIDGP